MTAISGARAVVEVLLEEGVEQVFHLPGSQIIDILDEILHGMEETHKAGTRYPIPYQVSTPEYFVKMKKQLEKAKKN